MADYRDQVERGELHQTYRDLPERPYRSPPERGGGSNGGPGLRGCSAFGCLVLAIAGFYSLNKLTFDQLQDSPFSEAGDAYYFFHEESEPPLYEVLRFYDDGTVVGMSLLDMGDIHDFWRQKSDRFDRKSGRKGYYRITDETINFSIITTKGSIDYSGHLSDGNLILDAHSHVDGYRATGKIYQPLGRGPDQLQP
ncbi:MAG: hypothetical protein AAF604_06265 [Acidobacteriota bacterium]